MRKKLALLVFALAALTAASTIAPTPASADTCPKGSHLFVCPTHSFCCPNNAFCACL
jgi:hypothetical protein